MTAVTSSFPGFSLRKNGSKRLPSPFTGYKHYTGVPYMSENCGKVSSAPSCDEDCIHPVRSAVLRCYGALPCFFTVSQLSVAPNGSDGLVLSKCLTAAPLPCAACGLISLDERRRPERPEKHGKCRRQTGSGRKLAEQLTWNVVV